MKFGILHHNYIEPKYGHVTKKLKFLKFKMATAAILKIAFLATTH